MTEEQDGVSKPLIPSLDITKNLLVGWLVFGGALVITVAAYWMTSHQVNQRVQERFDRLTEEVMTAYEEQLHLHEVTLSGAAGLFKASENVTRGEWLAYISALELRTRSPGIVAVGYVDAMILSEAEAVSSSNAGDRILSINRHNILPVPKYITTFIEGFERAKIDDMANEPKLHDALLRSVQEQIAISSESLALLSGERHNLYFYTYLPVFNKLSPSDSQIQLQGWVYSVFNRQTLLDVVAQDNWQIPFQIQFVDHGSSGPTETQAEFTSLLESQRQGRTWSFQFQTSASALFQNTGERRPLVVLLMGLLVDVLLFYVILYLHMVNRHQQKSEEELIEKIKKGKMELDEHESLIDEGEKELEIFFELAPEAFLVIAQTGLIVKANYAAHKLFGFPANQLTGVHAATLIPNSVIHEFEIFIDNSDQNVFEGGNGFEAVKRDGSTFFATANVVPTKYRGEPHRVIAVHNITVQRQIERALADAKEKAESASRSKSEFIANMSHEIRTPLNAVLGSAQLLERSEPTASQYKYIQMIRSSGESLLSVINDILDFSKIESGCMDLTPAPFDLNDVLTRVAGMMSVTTGEKDVELVIKLDPQVLPLIYGDAQRIQQVLLNLIGNGLKFTESGHVVLEIQLKKRYDSIRQAIRFIVRDTGIGMNQELQEQLFQAFSQGDGSSTRRYGGVGLGLVISNKILMLMDSQLHIESELGRGSTFFFDVDFTLANAKMALPGLAACPKRIAIIEDNKETCASFDSVFCQLGWPTEVVKDIESLSLLDEPLLKEIEAIFVNGNMARWLSGSIWHELHSKGLPLSCCKILVLPNNLQAEAFRVSGQPHYHATLVKPLLFTSVLSSLDEAMQKTQGIQLLISSNLDKHSQSRFSNVKALLVEDNVYNQSIAQDLLDDMGVEVIIANNGQEAVDLVSDHPDDFDVILMDIHMPVMDGLTATHILRKGKHYTKPIIAMTAGVLSSEKEQYLNAGMDDFVPKPIVNNELFRALVRALPIECNTALSAPVYSKMPETEKEVRQLEHANILHVFNAERLNTLIRGRRKRLVRVIESLNAIAETSAATIQEGLLALQDKDIAKAHFAFHSFKGLVANYGADKLADQIQYFESMIREEADPSDVGEEIERIRVLTDEFIDATQQWIKEQEELLSQDAYH